jgi:hypothetical protein
MTIIRGWAIGSKAWKSICIHPSGSGALGKPQLMTKAEAYERAKDHGDTYPVAITIEIHDGKVDYRGET